MKPYSRNNFVSYVTCIFLAFQPYIITAADFGNWYQTTKNGIEISYQKCNDRYRIGMRCKKKKNEKDICGHEISNLSKWYFYKDHIIGEYTGESEFEYFIFNENNCTNNSFYEKEKYTKHIKSNKLRPLI